MLEALFYSVEALDGDGAAGLAGSGLGLGESVGAVGSLDIDLDAVVNAVSLSPNCVEDNLAVVKIDIESAEVCESNLGFCGCSPACEGVACSYGSRRSCYSLAEGGFNESLGAAVGECAAVSVELNALAVNFGVEGLDSPQSLDGHIACGHG